MEEGRGAVRVWGRRGFAKCGVVWVGGGRGLLPTDPLSCAPVSDRVRSGGDGRSGEARPRLLWKQPDWVGGSPHHNEVNRSQTWPTKATCACTDGGVFTGEPGLKAHPTSAPRPCPMEICQSSIAYALSKAARRSAQRRRSGARV